jgi:hypothetical protein
MNAERLHMMLQSRKANYVRAFAGGPAKVVLGDLARFCRANASTFHENPAIQAKLDGRREVWLRIQQHLQLNDAELWRLLTEGDG